MIVEPERYVEDLLKGAGHLSMLEHNARLTCTAPPVKSKNLGKRVCTILHAVRPTEYVLELCDLVLIMSVNPGFGGQSFIPTVVPKIWQARCVRSAVLTWIEVDGGLKENNTWQVIEAGAMRLWLAQLF